MLILTKTLLVIVYPLLLLAWLVNKMLRRDRLRLYDVPSAESCWIERRAQHLPVLSYFSEESCSEGGGEESTSRPLVLLLRGIARVYTPSRQVSGAMYKASADREQGIPDEVYTLW
jgi:hypothetical protein